MRIYLLIFVTIFLFWRCDSVESDWETARKVNTKEAYQNFLMRHPGSEFDSTAKMQIEELAWEEAISKNTYQAFTEFLQNHPNSRHLPEINVEVDFKSYISTNIKNVIDSSLTGYGRDDLGVQLKDMSVQAEKGKLTASGRVVPDLTSNVSITGTFVTMLGNIEKLATIDSINYVYGDSNKTKIWGWASCMSEGEILLPVDFFVEESKGYYIENFFEITPIDSGWVLITLNPEKRHSFHLHMFSGGNYYPTVGYPGTVIDLENGYLVRTDKGWFYRALIPEGDEVEK